MPVAQLFPEEQAFLPEEPGTCPVYPNGSASPEAAPAPQPVSVQKSSSFWGCVRLQLPYLCPRCSLWG
ncbi:hypothetical protein XENTR_v10024991 [Xenopus tropicalis]|nr:hypothetical protein XENTR_v10024991 [Xenopus tropicalis]